MISLTTTKQDRKRVRNTAIVFSAIFAVCACLAGIFFGIMPRAKDIKSLGGEEISQLIESHDEKTFFVLADNVLAEFDAYSGEELFEFNLTAAVEDRLNSDGSVTVENSLDQWTVAALTGETENWFIAVDGNGNFFKLLRAESGLEVQGDYSLIGKDDSGNFDAKQFKAMDNIGDRLFALVVEKGFYYVEEYNMNDLSEGVVGRKFLWDLGIGNEDGYQKIEAVKAATGMLAFYATGDHILFFKTGGGIIRISADFIDSKYDAEVTDFFEDAKAASERDEETEALYQQIYNDTYRQYLIDDLIARREKKVQDGQEFTKSEEEIRATEDIDELLAVYTENGISNTTVSSVKRAADKQAKEAAEAATAGLSGWFKDYQPSQMTVYIKEEYLDKDCYASYIPGESSINGMIYSEKNDAVYYANVSDGYLYVLNTADLAAAPVGSFISALSARIDSVHCGSGQSFSNFGNGLGYNKFANTVYLKFANERQVTIVDLNDTENYRVVVSYTGAFDMFSLIGDSKNAVTHVMRQVIKTNIKGVDTPLLYVCTYQPEKFANKPTMTILAVIFLVIAAITFFVALWLWLSLRSNAKVKTVKFIVHDTKKNVFVYLALAFFVVMLVLFCYYEAVGAISMSFFNYTREKPAWIWNNFANYVKIFNDSNFWPSILNMLFFLVFDIVLGIVPPLAFALLIVLIKNKTTSSWIRSLMFIPGIIPSIATMLIWRVGIYGDEGLLNQMIMATGGQPVNWLLHEDFARWSLIFMGFPFVGGYLIFYGGLVNIPNEYHEAAKLEGMGVLKQFFKIDIPLIRPQIKYIFITTFIASVQNFARTHILRSTVVKTPVQSMYEMMTAGNYGMSSAYATLLFVFLFIAIATNFKMQKQDAMGADL